MGALRAIVLNQLSFAVFEHLRGIDVTPLRVKFCPTLE
jgi:hypothetical protein